MDILTKGGDKLRAKSIIVAQNLADRQKYILKEHREGGLKAYFKSGQLVIASLICPPADFQNMLLNMHSNNKATLVNNIMVELYQYGF